MLKCSLLVNWLNGLSNEFEMCREHGSSKVNEIEWLLLSSTDALQKDNEQLRVNNKQLKANWEDKGASLIINKKSFISCWGDWRKLTTIVQML